MSIPKVTDAPATGGTPSAPASRNTRQWLKYLRMVNPFGARPAPSADTLTFANNFFIMVLGWAIFAVICIADVYALVSLLLVTPESRFQG